jgi:hypothetical protein
MKKKQIKSIDEFYSQTLTGDSFNSSNGVFKVDYKPYSDLSISMGRDADPSILVKDSRFQVGDFVKGNVQGKKKKITGEIIEVSKSGDGKYYIIKIQSQKSKRSYVLIPGSIEFVEDRGNSTNALGANVSARERMAQNTKYDGGNIVWGSLENKETDFVPSDPEMDDPMEGPLGTGWKVKFVDNLPEGEVLFNSVVTDPVSKTIFCLLDGHSGNLQDLLKAVESYVYLLNHDQLKQDPKDMIALMSVIFLEIKNELYAKKIIVQNFPEIAGKSYGESRDQNFDKAKSMINGFL